MSSPRRPTGCAAPPAAARSRTSASRADWGALSATSPSPRISKTCCAACTAPASTSGSATRSRAPRARPTRGCSCSSSRSSCGAPWRTKTSSSPPSCAIASGCSNDRPLAPARWRDRLAGRPGADLVVQGTVGVMVNEEDHLRLHGMRSGFALEEAYADLEALDADLGRLLPFAFHPEFGYLTSCPTNAGTGLRASVLIHLPGLVLTKEIGKVLQGLTQVGLTFRGLYGEGSEVVGNFFQLSNQTTLGKSEEELLDHLGKIVRQVLEYEQQARDVILKSARTEVQDKVWRAYGLLRHARRL